MDMLIAGGRVVDPGHFDGVADILLADGKVHALIPADSPDFKNPASKFLRPGVTTFDASGKIVTPGLIDLHVHLREPGFEHKETIATGCRAAVSGGFTAVCCMANTRPVNDSRQVTEFVLTQARQAGMARVYPVAAVSLGLDGRELTDFVALKQAGAVAVSDDGRPVMDSRLMRRALEEGRRTGLAVISHCEDPYLAAGGVMNEGPTARRLGVAGVPNAAESIMVMRDIALSELTGAPVHIAHVSARESVRAIRAAKKRGVPVTAETAPHYLLLTEEAVAERGAGAKMSPPLRTDADRRALREALADGTIDCIATDHAPHSNAEKAEGLAAAPNGVIGLETALPLCLSLVDQGVLPLTELIAKLSTAPARILGIACGLRPGMRADVTVIDPAPEYVIDHTLFRSLSRNSPFLGLTVKGRPVLTVVGGRPVFESEPL